MTDLPPPLTPEFSPEPPRWIVADGLLEVPAPFAPLLQQIGEELERRTGLAPTVTVESGRAFALLPDRPLAVEGAAPPAGARRDPGLARVELTQALTRICDEVGRPDQIGSTWRLTEFGSATVTETAFAVTHEGSQPVSRTREIAPEDMERLLPRANPPVLGGLFGRLNGPGRYAVVALLVLAAALLAWMSPFTDRWLAPETLSVELGPLQDSLIVTQATDGPDYVFKFVRTEEFPRAVSALRARENAAATPTALAAWRALADRRTFFVEMRDDAGRGIRRQRVAIPALVKETSVEVRLRRDRHAVGLVLRHD